MVVKVEDEYRHAAPEEHSVGLWGDTLWVSVVDREANIFGINHFHLTNKGWGRFEALYVIDGVQQQYGNKHPLTPEADQGPWTDGLLTYEVINPLEEIRIAFDGPRFGFDLNFKGRFDVFDYHDNLQGNPLGVGHYYGGHFEQGLHCTGPFEIRGGPNKGEVRQLDSFSHRDHSWSTRFADEPPWEYSQQNVPNHFWPSIQLPDKHINCLGIYSDETGIAGMPGGFISDKDGSRPIHGASCEVLLADNQRDAIAFRYAINMPDGEILHVRTGRKYGQLKLWDRGENDLENRLDCYEPFFDFEVEETGETGYGVAEYSVAPPWPRWLV
ncbi:MAG: hypothetical protein QF515_17520 [Pseudomonadales bacterium]|jgi:hypothetical protein|nr:hypothetical protein [Pseudomonadales bacterium]MDP6469651.1 hypothetical protein [Pseudomonadales bacterium]MDP6828892.1 hypothetical protein [Pseudomonadales bacterium]|tara:strand:+ start:2995 stop:3975 length:981 start_codon:yes stop_codon:yes gene_type:complete